MIDEVANRIAPLLNTSAMKRIAVIDVTTSSARFDLSTRLTKINEGHMYTFKAVGGTVYLAFTNADAGTVDDTAVSNTSTGTTECLSIPDGGSEDWEIPDGHTWLVVKGSAACKLRIALSSRNQNQTVGKGEI